MKSPNRLIGVLSLSVALSGCELWLNVSVPQCKSDAACVSLLGVGHACSDGTCVMTAAASDAGADAQVPQLPQRWACAAAGPKNFIPNPDKTVQLKTVAVDLATLHVPSALSASVCMERDVSCGSPIAQGIAPGSDGYMTITLPYGFEGFFQFQAPDVIPAYWYSSQPYLADEMSNGPPLLTQTTIDDLYAQTGSTYDPSSGTILVEMRDCSDAAGDGVQFADLNGQPAFYFDGAAASTALQYTTISNVLAANREPRAFGGFTHVTPNIVTVRTLLPNTQQVLAKITVVVSAGYVTYVRLYPGG